MKLVVMIAAATLLAACSRPTTAVVERGALGCPSGYVELPNDRCVQQAVWDVYKARQGQPATPWTPPSAGDDQIARINADLARQRQVAEDAKVQAKANADEQARRDQWGY